MVCPLISITTPLSFVSHNNGKIPPITRDKVIYSSSVVPKDIYVSIRLAHNISQLAYITVLPIFDSTKPGSVTTSFINFFKIVASLSDSYYVLAKLMHVIGFLKGII